MEALRLWRTNITEAHQLGDLQGLGNSSTTLAFMLVDFYRAGEPIDLNEAEEALIKAIEISDRGIGSRVIPRCLLSMVHVHKGEFDKAHLHLAEAKDTGGTTPSILDESWMKYAEAETAYLEMRWSDALAAFEAAAEMYKRMERQPRWARMLTHWADVHISRGEPGDLERAEALLQDAKSAFEEMGAPYFVGIIEKKLEGLQAEAEK
jgi:tetratricopeptide (TPR) repeat protein